MTNTSGFLLVDKPEGITSHDVVDKLRKITGIKKIGHAGTLDPFATGLLILAIGRDATKKIDRFVKLDKKYEAEAQLGATTDTCDKNGKLTAEGLPEGRKVNFNKDLAENEIKKILFSFIGEIEQTPPMYSAKKVKGKKLYELARQGVEIEREPIRVKIYDMDMLEYQGQTLRFFVHCSSGTYVRILAHDLGQKLGCGGYLKGLRRTAIGEFDLEKSIALEELTKDNWEDQLFHPQEEE